MLNKIVKGLAVLVALLILVVVGLWLYLDSGQYRSALKAAVASNTGYQLSIAGDVELDLYPEVNLTLTDVRLRNPDSPQELASTSAITLRLDGGLLFQGQLFIRELSADDLHINYYVDADGNNIWTADSETEETAATATSEDGAAASGDSVAVAFESISVRNASMDIQDLSQGSRYSLRNLNLESQNANVEGRPFDLQLELQLLDDGTNEPVDLGFDSTLVADLDAGNIEVNDIRLSITPMLMTGQVALTDLDQAMSLTGNLQAGSFDLEGLMQSLGMSQPDELPGEPTDPSEFSVFAIDFSGSDTQFTLNDFSGNLGPTTVEATASVRYATDFAATNVRYELRLGTIDLSGDETALSETDEAASTAGNEADTTTGAITAAQVTSSSEPTPIPTELLTTVELVGSTYIAAVTAGDLRLDNVNLLTNVEGGVLDVELLPATAYGGNVQGSVRLDARDPNASFSTQLNLSQLNIAEFEDAVTRLDAVTGTLNVQSDYTAQGETFEAMLASLTGATRFDIGENTVNIGLIKQIFTAIAALSPTGEAIQQWPDVLQFGRLDGAIELANGVTENQQLSLFMDNFAVSGTGGFDLVAGDFDYELSFSLQGPPEPQTIPINPLYHDVAWPVSCAAAFVDDVNQWCRPDFSQVREIFAQIGANAIEQQLEEEILEQVPEELQDATQNLIRRILN